MGRHVVACFVLRAGMDLVMRTYERELKKPLRNLVGGELVRALLIQVRLAARCNSSLA
jgi:hypothetical protein